MKTTIEIPDDLLRRAKSRAAMKGLRLKDLVVCGLEWALTKDADEVGFRQTFPIVPGTPGNVIPAEAVQHALKQAEDEGFVAF